MMKGHLNIEVQNGAIAVDTELANVTLPEKMMLVNSVLKALRFDKASWMLFVLTKESGALDRGESKEVSMDPEMLKLMKEFKERYKDEN